MLLCEFRLVRFLHTSDDRCSTDTQASFSDWKFAYLFNINQVKLEDGNATRFSLDISSLFIPLIYHSEANWVKGARYLQQYSVFKDSEKNPDSDSFIADLRDFFTEYFNLLESAEYHVIYHYDVRWPHLGISNPFVGVPMEFDDEPENGEWRMEVFTENGQTRKTPKAAVWNEVVGIADTGGYGVIMALSQTAINSNYRTMWQSSSETGPAGNILRKWTHGDTLEAHFQRINIRLLSDSAAIIWIHLEHGSLRTQRTRGLLSRQVIHQFHEV
jgi:hypothetical protein